MAAIPSESLIDDDAFAVAVASRAAELGLTYLSASGPRPIAVALPRTADSERSVRERAHIAHVVLSALVKVGAAALSGELGEIARASLVAGLSPFELRVLAARTKEEQRAPRLVTARADMLVDEHGAPWVVEVNTTIPAMQGYSDIAARAWAEVVLERGAGLPRELARIRADQVLSRVRTNADDLLDALVRAYALDGGASVTPSIALVHRAGDSQLGELSFLAARFRARGHEAHTVVADALVDAGAGRLAAGAFSPDILYRHIFARRLEPESAFARALADARGFHVYNPISAPLEQKAALAALSMCADDDAMAARVGLTEQERALTQRHVPWTRVLDGAVAADVAREPARFVLKQSWDFGGKSVVLGGEERAGWAERVAAAAASGGYVVQRRVTMRPSAHKVAVDGHAETRALYVDASSYASFGAAPVTAGAVKRASASPIVNIQSGGGVMPVVTEALLRELDAVTSSRT